MRRIAGSVVQVLACCAGQRKDAVARVERVLVHVAILLLVAERWQVFAASFRGIVREVRGV